MELFSLDSDRSFDYRDLQLFGIFTFEVDFSQTCLMTSAENSILEPPNLKIFLERIPPDPSTRPLLFGAHDNVPPPLPPPPLQKSSYCPGCAIAVKITATVNAVIISIHHSKTDTYI